jgi:hypothetical protein
MTVSAGRRKLYVVRLKSAGWSSGGGCPHHIKAVFTDRTAAEACRVGLERALRPTVRDEDLFWRDPHHAMNPLDLTEFDEPVFLDWLRDAAIPVPDDTSRKGWLQWWRKQCEQLSADQLRHFFEGLHRLAFYEIREVDWIDADDGWLAVDEWCRDTGKPYPEGPVLPDPWEGLDTDPPGEPWADVPPDEGPGGAPFPNDEIPF